MMEALAERGARVLLIGTGQHAEGSGLDSLPTVERSVRDMGDALIERCGLGWDRLRIVLDAVTPTEIGLALAEEAERATSLLMIYYVGHGLVGLGGELYLATRATDARPGWLAHTALAYNAVRNSLLESPATSLIVVLDCCYSGRAVGVLGSSQSEAANLAQVYGAFVLTSAASNELALAPEGAAYTKFTGEFLNLLLNGDSRGPEQLTLHDIYTHLARALPASGGPLPRYVSSGRADNLVLASNPAYRGRDRRRTGPAGPDVCPYPGLAAFEPHQAKWFFGRERLTAELAARLTGRLAEGTPLVVVAPSGAGKSSLLRAGLVPAVADGALAAPGSHNWPRLMMTPGARPFAALAAQLAPLLSADPAAIADSLAREPARSAGLFREVLGSLAVDGEPAGARVILIVDQLEELFTLCTDESERRAFIDLLGVLASGTAGADPAGLLVLGLRADFYGRCAAFPQLRDAVQRDQVLVGPMSAAELREAIERPAQEVGLDLEPGLAELLLRDIGASDGRAGRDGDLAGTVPGAYEPGRLPLIAYALQATWEQRTDHTLTVAGYQETGGIQHAIATAADRTFDALPEESQAAARSLFLRLVKIGDGTQDTRRSVSEAELLQHGRSRGAGEQVLAAFVGARLLTSNEHGIEISHEALLQAWPRLAQWISTDRAGNLLGQEVEDAAAAWERSGHDSSDLLRGGRLEAATGWAAGHSGQGDVSPITRDFLRESKRQQNRSSHLRRAAVAVLAVLALVAAGTAWFALGQRNSAEASSRVAVLNQITAEADQVSSTDQSLAAELNVLAYRMKPSAATYTRLISAENTPLATVLPIPSGSIDSVAFSPNGNILAAGTSSGARLWNVSNRTHPRPLGAPLAGGMAASVAFSPNGSTLAVGTDSGTRLWNLSSPAHPRLLGAPLAARVSSVAFSPNGGILAVGTDSGVQLWNVSNPAQPQPLGAPLTAEGITNPRLTGGPVPTPTDAVATVAFSANGSTLGDAIGSSIQLWNMSDPAQPRLFGTPLGPLPYGDGHASLIYSLAFSRSGILAAGAADHHVHLWDVANPAQPVSYGSVVNDTDSVTSVAFSPDGDILATGSDDDTASLWNVTAADDAWLLYSALTGHTQAILAVAMSPDGHTLATAGADHTIRLWTLPNTVLTGHLNYVSALAVSRARGIAASGSPDDTLRLWDVASPAHPGPLGGPVPGPAQYNALSFSPNGLILAAATSADDVQLWQTADPRHPTLLAPPLAGFGAYVATVGFSPNGRVLAAGSFDHTIRLWDVADPARPVALGPPLTGPAGGVSSVAFSPDGRTLAAASLDGTVRLWDVTDPARPIPLGRPLAADGGSVYSVAFSPDGGTLASGDADGTVQLWDVRDPGHATALGSPLTGHTDTVAWVTFSPDGDTLATASWDDTIRLWNVVDPARPRAIGGPVTGDPNYINVVAFGPGNHTLIGADGDDTVRIWNLSAATAIQHICAATVNVLTPSQWHRYVSELPYDPPCGASR
jgi:WD40 repeat protein